MKYCLIGCAAIVVGMQVGCSQHPAPRKVLTYRVVNAQQLQATRDTIRSLVASNRADGVEVVLAAGEYNLSEPLKLTKEDSEVTWRGEGDVVFTRSTLLTPDGFRPTNDPRLPAEARGKVMEYDLSKLKIVYGNLPTQKECRAPLNLPELFVNEERMNLARWPNEGWTTIERFVETGMMDNDGSVGDALGNKKNAPKKVAKVGGTFGYAGDRPARWVNAKNVCLHGFWCFDWYDAIIPVESINTVSNTITFAAKHCYGIRKGNPSPRRWRAINLIEELDMPGEYYIDADAKKLFLYPPKNFSSTSDVRIADTYMTLIQVEGASNITLKNLTFAKCFATPLLIHNSERITVEDCKFTLLRQSAIHTANIKNCRIARCSISECGSGGISLNGGERKTLTKGGNIVEDTLFKNFSVHNLTYASAINIGGVGNIVRHNEFTGAPHMAVGLHGNDNIFEFNVVSNVCMSSDDAAAYYKGRNPSCRGNICRFNFWCNIGSPRGHGNAAIYFDDGDGGDLVYGDVFYRCGEPGKGSFGTVFSHGGYSNVVRNCIFIECKRPLGSAPWNQQRWADFLQSPLEQKRLTQEVDIRVPPFTTRYPELINYFKPDADELRWNAAFDNVFVDCPQIISGRWFTNSTDFVTSDDIGFKDKANLNFALSPSSPIFTKLPTFKPIPFEKIGRRNK